MNTRQKGNKGEEKAVEYLLDKGYKIISQNYQSRKGEIDCIAEADDGTLVFIEVKAGLNPGMGHPFHRINRSKQRKIIIMAKMYLKEHSITDKPCRFDAIAIVNNEVEHLKNAFIN